MEERPEDRDWLTVEAFALRHGVGKSLVYEQARRADGPLIAIKVGGKVLIRSDSLDRLAERQRETAGTA